MARWRATKAPVADRHVDHLLIGGGLACGNCARWLRESGAGGSILLVGREPDLPYNRPPCSKEYLRGSQSRTEALFRPREWYEEQRIEVLTRTSAMKLDPSQRTVSLSNRTAVSFDTALIATGANVRRLNVEGGQLEGIHYLRTLANSDAIREDAAGKRVVLIGGSYIATEVAASLTELGSVCAIVMLEPVVLSRGFGEQVGRFLQDRLQEHGVAVYGDDELDRFEGADGHLTHVVTKRGHVLEADCVVMGTGAVPDVTLARNAGLKLGESGGVEVDAKLRTSAPGVYAAGDIAEYDSVIHGRPIRIEHWDVAFNHGKTAALNMLGADQPHDVVPYFFSDLSDWASLEYVGPASSWDEQVVRGSIADGEFSVWYLKDRRLAAALSVGRSDDLEHARRMLASGTDLSARRGELSDRSNDLSVLSGAT
jgi:3-phenylpropionate/trans-cinnamate dioxygenase ferredoxin reductase subunit